MSNFKIAGHCAEITKDLKEQLELIIATKEKAICLEDINGIPFTELEPEYLKKEIHPIIKKSGIEVASIITKIGLRELDDEDAYQNELVDLEAICKVCSILRTKYVSIYTPYILKEQYEEAYPAVLEQIKGFVAIAQKQGVVLLLEHSVGTYASKADRIMKIINDISSNYLRIVFNPSSYMKTKEVPMAAYRYVKEKVDFFYMRDMNSMLVTVPIGMGNTKVYELLRMAVKEGYNGYVCLKSEMNEYLNRKKVYSKAIIPLFSLISRRYRTFKIIDFKLKASGKEVTPAYLFSFQMRLLRKLVDKVSKG